MRRRVRGVWAAWVGEFNDHPVLERAQTGDHIAKVEGGWWHYLVEIAIVVAEVAVLIIVTWWCPMGMVAAAAWVA